MSTHKQQVAEPTEQKEAMIYDLFNLTEKQADSIIDTVEKENKTLKKTGNQCDYLKAVLDSVNTPEEKYLAAYYAGKMSEMDNNPFSFLNALSN